MEDERRLSGIHTKIRNSWTKALYRPPDSRFSKRQHVDKGNGPRRGDKDIQNSQGTGTNQFAIVSIIVYSWELPTGAMVHTRGGSGAMGLTAATIDSARALSLLIITLDYYPRVWFV